MGGDAIFAILAQFELKAISVEAMASSFTAMRDPHLLSARDVAAVGSNLARGRLGEIGFARNSARRFPLHASFA
jgi:hypothetical protein